MATSIAPLRVLVNSAGIGWAQRTVGKDGSYESAANQIFRAAGLPAGFYDDPSDYADPDATLRNARTYSWMHPVGEIVTGILAAGMSLKWLHEHDRVPWRMFGILVEGGTVVTMDAARSRYDDGYVLVRDGEIAVYCNLEEERKSNRKFLMLEIRGDQKKFVDSLAKLGCEYAISTDSCLKVVLQDGVEVRDLYRLAAETQVQVRRLSYKRDSLEDIFLKAMENGHGRL